MNGGGGFNARSIGVLGALIVLASGTGSYVQNALNPPRPDPFTGAEARALRDELRDELQRHEALLRREFTLDYQRDLLIVQSRMPPQPTRSRVSAIEQWIQSQDEEWQPPTTRWAGQAINFDGH